jgi:hypothetical protein
MVFPGYPVRGISFVLQENALMAVFPNLMMGHFMDQCHKEFIVVELGVDRDARRVSFGRRTVIPELGCTVAGDPQNDMVLPEPFKDIRMQYMFRVCFYAYFHSWQLQSLLYLSLCREYFDWLHEQIDIVRIRTRIILRYFPTFFM